MEIQSGSHNVACRLTVETKRILRLIGRRMPGKVLGVEIVIEIFHLDRPASPDFALDAATNRVAPLEIGSGPDEIFIWIVVLGIIVHTNTATGRINQPASMPIQWNAYSAKQSCVEIAVAPPKIRTAGKVRSWIFARAF